MNRGSFIAGGILTLLALPIFSGNLPPTPDPGPPVPAVQAPAAEANAPAPPNGKTETERPADYAARILAMRARRAGELASTAEAFSYQFIANPSLNLALAQYGAAEDKYNTHPWNGVFSDYLEGIHDALPELDDAVFFDADEGDRIPLTMTDSLTRDVRRPIRQAILAPALEGAGKAVWDAIPFPRAGETDRAPRFPALLCARLVKNLYTGKPIGVLVLILDPDRLERTVTGSAWDESDGQAPKADFTVLVDGRGLVLAAPDPAMIGRRAAEIAPGMEDILRRRERGDAAGSGESVREGRRILIVFSKVPDREWILVSILPQTRRGVFPAPQLLGAAALVLGSGVFWVGRRKRSGRAVPAIFPEGRPPSWFGALSPRERRILLLMASGKSNKEIAQLLDLREQTVKNYLHSVYARIGVQDRVSATLLVERAGLSLPTERKS